MRALRYSVLRRQVRPACVSYLVAILSCSDIQEFNPGPGGRSRSQRMDKTQQVRAVSAVPAKRERLTERAITLLQERTSIEPVLSLRLPEAGSDSS